ncbi:MAG: phytanoyl-CoA dioxygenase family protein [Cyanobacteria bacterium J06600_6]
MSNFCSAGYQIIEQLIDSQTVVNLRQAIADNIDLQSDYGVRRLHRQIHLVNELAHSNLILDFLHHQVDHSQFRLIKAIYFNKNANYNWSVPWHQDKTVAVTSKVELAGFKNWTTKQGVPHVQPPLNILEAITTIRIALDNTNARNGGLKTLPRSHHLGILNQAEINQIVQQQSPIFLQMQAGDALIMHPLILHSSNKSMNQKSRRIIHLEYSSGDLPEELAWY